MSVSVSLLTVQLVGPAHVTDPGRKCAGQRFETLSPASKDSCTTHPRVWHISLQGYKKTLAEGFTRIPDLAIHNSSGLALASMLSADGLFTR